MIPKTIAVSYEESIIINYIGYPAASLNSFQEDSGLGMLIASAKQSGYHLKVIDYATLELMKRLRPKKISEKLKKIWPFILRALKEKKKPPLGIVFKLFILSKQAAVIQRAVENELADDLIKSFKPYKPLLIGARLWMGDSFHGTVRILKRIKKAFPDLPVVGGGSLVNTVTPLVLKKYGVFDYLIQRDGEQRLVSLMDYLSKKSSFLNTEGIQVLDQNKMESAEKITSNCLEKYPSPVYSPEEYRRFGLAEGLHVRTIDSARGCNNACHFCVVNAQQGALRERPEKQIVDQIEDAYLNQGIKLFRLGGPNTSYHLIERISDEIIKRGLKDLYLSAYAQVKGAQKEVLEKAKRAGFEAFFLGIESTADEFQKTFYANKSVSYQDVIDTVRLMKRIGFSFITGSFISGFPRETENDWKNTKALIKECAFDSVLINPFGLYPEAEIFKRKDPAIKILTTREKYEAFILQFKVNLLLPSLMKNIPYKVNGMSFKKIILQAYQRREELETELFQAGIDTVFDIDGDLGLIVKLVGSNLKDFVMKTKEYFFTGDYTQVAALINHLNNRLSSLKRSSY